MPDQIDRPAGAEHPATPGRSSRLAIRTIVLATDFDVASAVAQVYAVALAERLGATLHVLHVIGPPMADTWYAETPSLAPGVLVEAWVKAAETRLRRETLPALARVADVRLAVTVGRPAGEIARYADSKAADLLILGAGRPRGSRGLRLGSVARRVVHEARCPVLTAAEECHPRDRPAPVSSRHAVTLEATTEA